MDKPEKIEEAAFDLYKVCKKIANSPRGEGLHYKTVCELMEAIDKAEDNAFYKMVDKKYPKCQDCGGRGADIYGWKCRICNGMGFIEEAGNGDNN